MEMFPNGMPNGSAEQSRWLNTAFVGPPKVVSTDPPYYDNIGYADLSDYFYVWLRRSLKPVFPDLLLDPRGAQVGGVGSDAIPTRGQGRRREILRLTE